MQRDDPCSFEFLPWYENTIKKLQVALELRKIRSKTRPFLNALIDSLNSRFKDMEPIVLISAFLFPSQGFRKGIEPTSITNGLKALKEWAEQRFDQNNETTYTQLPYSQLMDLDNESIEDADNYVELSLEQMMELGPRKKTKIDKEIPNERENTQLTIEEEIERFELFIRDHGIEHNVLKSVQESSPFQEKGSFPQWWVANGNNFPQLQKIAFSMCGVQPSNGGVERVFSYTKMLVEGRRNRISIESLRNRMVLLMNNYRSSL